MDGTALLHFFLKIATAGTSILMIVSLDDKFQRDGTVKSMSKLFMTAAAAFLLASQICMAQQTGRAWSATERAFLQAKAAVDENPADVKAMKAMTQISQQLVKYYVKEESNITPYDLDARIQWYEQAVRTGNILFDRTYDQKISELSAKKTAVLQQIEQVESERDALRRLSVLRELEPYKPYLPGVGEVENQTVKELFNDYKTMEEGPPQVERLKLYLDYVKTSAGKQLFSLVYNDFKSGIAALLADGKTLKAGARADMALLFWPTDRYFQDIARQNLANF